VAEAVQAGARAVSGASGPSPLSELTDRERDVLGLMAQGYTNKQIGEALRITANTVKKHVDHILQKLRVSNRAGAVAVALQSGLKPEVRE
jgi:DNA-binding NarL/FixJ family response regulator